MSSGALRVFLAHPKAWEAERVSAAVEKLTKLYTEGLQRAAEKTGEAPARVQVVSGRDDCQKRMGRAGGWNAWAKSVSGSLPDGRARFHRILATSPRVGRATGGILEACLKAGRDVFLWDGEAALERVVGVTCEDPGSWQDGWVLVLRKRV